MPSEKSTACAMLIAALFLAAAPLHAQIPPDREALLNGDGAGMGAYAEANGYPGPKHVLELAEELGLTARQRADVREVFDEMKSRARSIGKMIVKVEEELHAAFASGMIKGESVEDDAESIGKLRGALRAAHLTAHLRTKELLTPDQVKRYVTLRKKDR